MRPLRAGVICLGASAGGLPSLQAILAALPADLPWPVLVTQHLQADRVSELPGILARSANAAVREATDGESPIPGTIYTSPPSRQMGLTLDGRIALTPLPAGTPPRSIDHLFATASYAHPARTIAVVLSGTGNDGAVGALVVKLNAGTVLAEDNAEHGSMPEAARRAGAVDASLPAATMGPILYDLATGTLERTTLATRAMVDAIAGEITTEQGPDLVHYREGTLRRQAEKRRALLGLATLQEYRDRLREDPHERARLTRALFVPVTEFFRDADAWRELEQGVIPQLAARARDAPVRVWCVGCASGEEAYSIAILLSENIADKTRIQVLGTDIDADNIRKAAAGTFDAARLASVDALRKERFFRLQGEAYQASDDLRRLVHFRVHDATRDATPGAFDLILCRNLLVYFDDTLQARVLATLRRSLEGPRLLVLGRSETVPPEVEGFRTLSRPSRIYQALPTTPETRSEPALLGPHAGGMLWSAAADVRIEEPDALVFVLDERLRVHSANPRAQRVMGSDLETEDLLDVFPRWQGSPVLDALRACVATGRSLKVRAAPSPVGPVDVTIEPAPGPERRMLLIATPALAAGRHPATPQAADEDLSAARDELQSANEELVASNEELQATNEELATLNEEFQATNQSLATTNVEMAASAKIVGGSVDLSVEYLLSRPDPIAVCDRDGRLAFHNRAASERLHVERTDVGRPAHALGLGVEADDLLAPDPPPPRTISHLGERWMLTIERLGRATTLGWVLTWKPA